MEQEKQNTMPFDFGDLEEQSESSAQSSAEDFSGKDEELKKELDGFDFASLEGAKESPEETPEPEQEDEQETPDSETAQEDGQETEDSSEQEDIDSEAPSEDASSSSSSELYAPVIAKALHSEGVLSEFDEEQFSKDVEEYGEGKALLNALTKQVETEAERRAERAKSEYDANLTDEQKEFQDMLREGIPYEEAKELMTGYKRYDGINDDDFEENEELARKVIKDNYKKTTKFSDSKIDKLIDKLDEEEIVEEAVSSKKSLIDIGKEEARGKYDAQVQQRKESEERGKAIMKEMKDYVYSTKDISGIKLDDSIQDKVYKSMTTAVDNINGQPVNDVMKKQYSNPVKFNTLQSLYNELGLYDFDSNGNPSPNFSKLKKYLKTDGVSILEKELKAGDKKGVKGKSKRQSKPNLKGDQDLFLEALKKGQEKKIF